MTTVESAESEDGAMPHATQRGQVSGVDQSGAALTITWLRWGATVNIGNYESVRLDAEVAVPTDGSEDSMLDALRSWVIGHMPISFVNRDRFDQERRGLTQEIEELRAQRERAEWLLSQVTQYLRFNGMAIPTTLGELIPF